MPPRFAADRAPPSLARIPGRRTLSPASELSLFARAQEFRE
jgi:hypothetical protein